MEPEFHEEQMRPEEEMILRAMGVAGDTDMSEEALRGWPRGSMPVVEILADEEAPF